MSAYSSRSPLLESSTITQLVFTLIINSIQWNLHICTVNTHRSIDRSREMTYAEEYNVKLTRKGKESIWFPCYVVSPETCTISCPLPPFPLWNSWRLLHMGLWNRSSQTDQTGAWDICKEYKLSSMMTVGRQWTRDFNYRKRSLTESRCWRKLCRARLCGIGAKGR